MDGDGDISKRQITIIGAEAGTGVELEISHLRMATFCAEQALTDCEDSSVRPHDLNADG